MKKTRHGEANLPKATQLVAAGLNPLLTTPKPVFLDAMLYKHACPLQIPTCFFSLFSQNVNSMSFGHKRIPTLTSS